MIKCAMLVLCETFAGCHAGGCLKTRDFFRTNSAFFGSLNCSVNVLMIIQNSSIIVYCER